MIPLDVITGTRAEYGLLRPVLKKLYSSKVIQPRLVVTGTHLSPVFGNTVQEIEADGFPIHARLDILSVPVPEGRAGTAWRTLMALDTFLGHFSPDKLRPEAVLVLGDRFEIFAAAQAAALFDIPVAHISGGDVTQGADDDWFRHSISKMAKLHFPSCKEYRQRLLRMGEQPSKVFNVGGLGDENIRNMQLLEKQELASSLEVSLDGPFALVTFHPETASGAAPPRRQAQALLDAVKQNPGLFYIFTMANADAGGAEMNRMVSEYCAQNSNAVMFSSLGTQRYLSAMKHASVVLGNSSSGLVETPSFGTPAVNIGDRQAGRITGENVIHCPLEGPDISAAIQKALSEEFISRARQAASPYNGGDTNGKIAAVLEEMLESRALRGPKVFYDGPFGEDI